MPRRKGVDLNSSILGVLKKIDGPCLHRHVNSAINDQLKENGFEACVYESFFAAYKRLNVRGLISITPGAPSNGGMKVQITEAGMNWKPSIPKVPSEPKSKSPDTPEGGSKKLRTRVFGELQVIKSELRRVSDGITSMSEIASAVAGISEKLLELDDKVGMIVCHNCKEERQKLAEATGKAKNAQLHYGGKSRSLPGGVVDGHSVVLSAGRN